MLLQANLASSNGNCTVNNNQLIPLLKLTQKSKQTIQKTISINFFTPHFSGSASFLQSQEYHLMCAFCIESWKQIVCRYQCNTQLQHDCLWVQISSIKSKLSHCSQLNTYSSDIDVAKKKLKYILPALNFHWPWLPRGLNSQLKKNVYFALYTGLLKLLVSVC